MSEEMKGGMVLVDRNTLAALEADARRYRFLRNNTYVEAYWIDMCGGVDTSIRVQGSVDFLDKAIDADEWDKPTDSNS